MREKLFFLLKLLRNPAHFTAQSTIFSAQFVIEFPHNLKNFPATYRDPRNIISKNEMSVIMIYELKWKKTPSYY